MSEPHYGSFTACRPLLANVPDAPPGAVLTECPYCGAECWKLELEEIAIRDAHHGDATAACTDCALKRGQWQREMDRARHDRETAAKEAR